MSTNTVSKGRDTTFSVRVKECLTSASFIGLSAYPRVHHETKNGSTKRLPDHGRLAEMET